MYLRIDCLLDQHMFTLIAISNSNCPSHKLYEIFEGRPTLAHTRWCGQHSSNSGPKSSEAIIFRVVLSLG